MYLEAFYLVYNQVKPDGSISGLKLINCCNKYQQFFQLNMYVFFYSFKIWRSSIQYTINLNNDVKNLIYQRLDPDPWKVKWSLAFQGKRLNMDTTLTSNGTLSLGLQDALCPMVKGFPHSQHSVIDKEVRYLTSVLCALDILFVFCIFVQKQQI